ncbi:uncharacterized protein CELE_H40L08.9 [Caenorhabditis elegans]|uniref:Uncharacterized protein n=1 Tax=Caenorhabditis elegans TaxID=6239 RepID=A0A4V6Z7Z2_CAEEL|nr:Uncharacterized protein CELE_H40L08.9 [Caenorhabditis elegans]VTW47611.1 Uncharacterized protein CELE_H40L08.9 [Caenorhabditis elegans]
MSSLPASRSESSFVSAARKVSSSATNSKSSAIPIKKDTNRNRKVSAIQPRENSEESDKDDAKDFLKTELAAKLRAFDATWFKQTAQKTPEVFIDNKQYDQFARTK